MSCAPVTAVGVTVPPRSTPAQRLSRLYRHLTLWVFQSWLAMFFIAAGYAKLTQSQDLLALLMTWPGHVDPSTVRAVGWVEIGLAAGLLAPLISWRYFHLVMTAAAGTSVVETLVMAAYHALQGHPGLALVNGLLALLGVSVVVGRLAPTPDARR
jgi:hypothetical protein